MSFGFSPSDVVLLVQLAWRTVRNSRKACGEYAELTRETTSLHVNLQRLERETAKLESPINRPSDICRQDLAPIVDGCRKALDVLDRILEKYNALSDEERSKGKLWKAVRFGNGELANVKDLRLKLTYYTSNLSLFLNMVSMGSMGIVEKQMYEAGGDLKDIRRAVNGITAHLMSSATKEGSVLTDYAGDDKTVWRAFRRELVKGGFSSDVIREHKDTIQAYVQELGSRGTLDDEDLKDSGNILGEIEDTALTQATPQSRDEAIGSFESKSGAARDAVSPHTATTAHVDERFGTGNRDPRENGAFPQQTQIAPTPLTMNNVSDTLPSTTQDDAEIDSVVEKDSREIEKVDNRTSRHRQSASIPLAQSLPVLAEDNTWFLGGHDPRHAFWYYSYDYRYDDNGFEFISMNEHKAFKALSNPLVSWGEILEFQAEGNGLLKVAEVRTRLRARGSKSRSDRKALLRVSPLFRTPTLIGDYWIFCVNGCPSTIISDLMHYGLDWIDPRPEIWRITEWPLPGEKTEHEGHEDEKKGKGSTVPPLAASAVVEDTQNPSSTTEEVETEDDDEVERTTSDASLTLNNPVSTALRGFFLGQRRRREEVQLTRKPRYRIETST